MKRIITLIVAISALFLAGCATSHDKYYEAVKADREAQAAREARMAEQEARADAAMLAMGVNGDAAAKITTQAYFQTKGLVTAISRGNAASQPYQPIAPPVNEPLEYVKALSNPLATVAVAVIDKRRSDRQSDNAVRMNETNVNSQTAITLGGFNAIRDTGMAGINKPVYAMPIPTAAPAE